jgi:hypothetical protein
MGSGGVLQPLKVLLRRIQFLFDRVGRIGIGRKRLDFGRFRLDGCGLCHLAAFLILLHVRGRCLEKAEREQQ